MKTASFEKRRQDSKSGGMDRENRERRTEMKPHGFILVTLLLLLTLAAVAAFALNSRAGLQLRMVGNDLLSLQRYLDQLAIIEQTRWQLMNDIGLRVTNAAVTYNGKPYTRTVASSTVAGYTDAEMISVASPDGGRAMGFGQRYMIDSPVFTGLRKAAQVTCDLYGNLFFADDYNHRVWKWQAASGDVVSFAGGGTGGDNGPATNASLSSPSGVAVDSDGNVYISERGASRVRKVDLTGTISTFAGTGENKWSGDGGPATAAGVKQPEHIAVDGANNLYIATPKDCVIRKVTAATGIITTVAGIPETKGGAVEGAQATATRLDNPTGVSVTAAGDIYIADSATYTVRKVTAATGTINKVAGITYVKGSSGDGGLATSAYLDSPTGVHVDGDGNVFIADTANSRIRKVTASTGYISTFAGTSTGYAGDGGPATSAQLSAPASVCQRGTGELVISDYGNAALREVSLAGIISSLPGIAGATFNLPEQVHAHYDATAGKTWVYVADTLNHKIRKIDPVLRSATTVAGTGLPGFSVTSLATEAMLNGPKGVCTDGAGNVYIGDTLNNRIRMVSAATGAISSVAGNGNAGYDGDGGPAQSAKIKLPEGVSVDGAGNLYFADTGNHRIRKVSVAGIITTVAGTGSGGYSADNVPATTSKVNAPQGVFADGAGNLYIADTVNRRIRKVTAATGIITTVAGNGSGGYTGDGGLATLAKINNPEGVAVDGAGNLFIADTGNHVVRIVSVYDGIIRTLVGTGLVSGYNGEMIPAATALLNAPASVAVSGARGAGRIYIDDKANNRVRMVYPQMVKALY